MSEGQAVADRVNGLRTAFSLCWSLAALRVADPDIADALAEQIEIYEEARATNDKKEIVIQYEALCRGWMMAIRVMERERWGEQGVMIGHDEQSGLTVMISPARKTAADTNEKRVYVHPDDIASLLAKMPGLVAGLVEFPGAEIVPALTPFGRPKERA